MGKTGRAALPRKKRGSSEGAGDAAAREAAISDILRVISDSPGDLQPVFDTILSHSIRLCAGNTAVLWQFDGQTLGFAAGRNMTAEAVAYMREHPLELGRWNPTPQAALERRVMNVLDVFANPDYRPLIPPGTSGKRPNAGTVLAVPLVRGDELFGVITIWRYEKRLFSERELELMKTFTAQAVIAIQNVRLFNETKEALERQTATSDILKVIAGSPSDVQPVFDAIVKSVSQLFGRKAALRTVEAHGLRRRARSYAPAPGEYHGREIEPLDRQSIVGQAVLEGRALQWEDTLVDGATTYGLEEARKLAFRSIASAPLMREGRAIGVISVSSPTPGRLTDKEMALLSMFADQAVIAIENVRLFNETKESLEQQTATADILKVISGSPTDVRPVFDAILKSAVALCGAELAGTFRFDGKLVHLGATHNWSREALEYFSKVYPSPPSLQLLSGRTILTKNIVQISDAATDPHYDANSVITGHWRRMLGLPMLREGEPLGALVVAWREPGETPRRQVELLQTFANQAAIAIENVRLFNETKEALEQQTAISEVLRVISNAPADVQPVLEAVSERAARICDAPDAQMYLLEGDAMRHVVSFGSMPFAVPLGESRPLNRDWVAGRAVLEGKAIHIEDLLAVPREEYPLSHQLRDRAGHRTLLSVPLMRERSGLGAISLRRMEVRPFTEKQITLVKTFADQAAIAIENARLFREIQEKSTQLEIANKHKSEFLANMSHELRTPLNAIIGFSEVLSERMFGEVNEKQAEYLKDIHESGRHLLSLINDILDLSKIEAGRMELEVSTFDLPTALSNAMTLIRERAQRHGIQLGMEVDPALGEFSGDERKFKQIMLNLLSNAVKFTPDGGKVEVSAKRANGAVEVAVRDTGIGIAPEDQALVFEEFRQAGRDRMRKAEGTGLGLALARRFVELHGGAIRLDSKPGQGSTFTVSLPLSGCPSGPGCR